MGKIFNSEPLSWSIKNQKISIILAAIGLFIFFILPWVYGWVKFLLSIL